MARPKKDIIKKKNFSGYFSDDLYNAIKEDAAKEHRSLHSHVVCILEKYLIQKGALRVQKNN